MNAVSYQPHDEWPLAQHSSIVRCAGLHWHVQNLGNGPTVVLIHGTGASTHSWRDVAVNLSQDYTVLMFDLPGHGFTSSGSREQMCLSGMSRAVGALIHQVSARVSFIVGHSAGAALACQMVLDNRLQAERIASINGALKPFDGMAGQLFAPIAKALAVNPLIPRFVSWRATANDQLVKHLLSDTGSTLDSEGVGYYCTLLQRKHHVAGALGMMAQWDLKPLWQKLPRLHIPTLFLAGSQDRTVLPRQSGEACSRVQYGTLKCLNGLGHLSHEESPVLCSRELKHYFTQEAAGAQTAGPQAPPAIPTANGVI
ncbi:MAG: alpha/beta fold hydrolase BchO, partial [Pseudomonadota bacterium]